MTSTHQLAHSPPHQFHRILLVRLRQIGDVVFTTPAVAALRRQYQDAHLTYLVEPAAAPVVAGNPHLDEVIVAPRRGGLAGILADVGLGWRLRRAKFDLAIDFHGGPRASLLTLMSGAPRRIGYNVAGRRWIYTDVVGRPRELRRRHSVENQWDLLEALDVAAPTPSGNPVEMPVDPGAKQSVDERLTAAGVAPDEDLAVIHVSASSPFRRWPLPSFVDTVAALASRAGRRVIVTSGPSERGAATGIINDARAKLAAPIGTAWSAAATFHSRSFAPCWKGARSSSAATAARCTSRPRRVCRLSRFSDPRRRSVPRPGRIPRCCWNRSRSTGSPAGRAINASASPATSAA